MRATPLAVYTGASINQGGKTVMTSMTRRWTARGVAVAVAFALLWGAGGAGVYVLLGSHRSALAGPAARPGESGSAVSPLLAALPGSLYLIQGGALYRLQRGQFTTILPAGGWTQPAALPAGQGLIVVRRDASGFSDLYRVDAAGHTQQLTRDQGQGGVPGRDPGGQVVTQYWAMYPRVSASATQLYFATDRYKHVRCCPYDVTLRVAQMPVAGGTLKFWTADGVTQSDPHTQDGDYAGGDAQPVPLASGAVLFVRYALAVGSIASQLMLVTQPRAAPVALTAPEDHCAQPAVSPDGTKVALICSYGKQPTSIEVAAFDGTSLGPRRVVVAGVQAAQPAWSADGSRLVYLAPAGVAGHFQLWSATPPAALPTPTPAPARQQPAGRRRATPTPTPPTATATAAPPPPPSPGSLPPPVQLTTNLDFDATSPIAWGT